MSTLYLKYRPQTFDEVIGQSHITEILKAELVNGKLSHAYLFVGPRGTGKTSTARILAKAVNCEAPTKDGNPCGSCEVCSLINAGKLLDIVEIDAASNRRIDEIRALKEKIEYRPTRGKYKVYIIDEVHMLTREAFNALLKTLEEPPEHVIFILATTEPHKVPITIASRCERFEFRLGSYEELKQAALRVLKAENVEIEDEALDLLVKHAAGSYRDLLSLLDTFVGRAENGRITYALVKDGLGLPDDTMVYYFLSAVFAKESTNLFSMLEEIFQRGINLDQFLKAVISKLRDVAVAKTSKTAFPEGYEFMHQISLRDILHFLGLLVKAQGELKYAFDIKIPIQLAVLSMIDYLNGNHNKESDSQNTETASKVTDKTGEEISITKGRLEEEVNNVTAGPAEIAEDSEEKTSVTVLQPTKTEASEDRDNSKSNSEVLTASGKTEEQSKPTNLINEPRSSVSSAQDKSNGTPGPELDIEQVKKQWKLFISELKPYNGHLYAFLLQAKPVRLEQSKDFNSSTLYVDVKYQFHKERIELITSQQAIKEVSQKIFEKVLTIKASVNPKLISEIGVGNSEAADVSPSETKEVGVGGRAGAVKNGSTEEKDSSRPAKTKGSRASQHSTNTKSNKTTNSSKSSSDFRDLEQDFDDVFSDAIKL